MTQNAFARRLRVPSATASLCCLRRGAAIAGALAAAGLLSAGELRPEDPGVANAGPHADRAIGLTTDAGTPHADASLTEGCDAIEARIARRKAWLSARRQEQFERGPPDPAKGVPNAFQLYCESHPGNEECALGNALIEVDTGELAYTPDADPGDYDAHVVAMRRSLRECRERGKRIWP